jgi:ribosomal protein L4
MSWKPDKPREKQIEISLYLSKNERSDKNPDNSRFIKGQLLRLAKRLSLCLVTFALLANRSNAQNQSSAMITNGSNHAAERTSTRYGFTGCVANASSLRTAHAVGGRRSLVSR